MSEALSTVRRRDKVPGSFLTISALNMTRVLTGMDREFKEKDFVRKYTSILTDLAQEQMDYSFHEVMQQKIRNEAEYLGSCLLPRA